MKRIIIAVVLLVTSNVLAIEGTQEQVVNIEVTDKGFQPNSVDVKTDTPVILKVTRKTDSTCAKQVQIPSKKIKKDLPLNQTVSISVGKLEKGEIRFGCGMMMEAGMIHVK